MRKQVTSAGQASSHFCVRVLQFTGWPNPEAVHETPGSSTSWPLDTHPPKFQDPVLDPQGGTVCKTKRVHRAGECRRCCCFPELAGENAAWNRKASAERHMQLKTEGHHRQLFSRCHCCRCLSDLIYPKGSGERLEGECNGFIRSTHGLTRLCRQRKLTENEPSREPNLDAFYCRFRSSWSHSANKLLLLVRSPWVSSRSAGIWGSYERYQILGRLVGHVWYPRPTCGNLVTLKRRSLRGLQKSHRPQPAPDNTKELLHIGCRAHTCTHTQAQSTGSGFAIPTKDNVHSKCSQ